VSITPDLRHKTDESVHIADSVVRGFAEFATTLDHEDLTEAALRAAKRCLIDALGCALGAQGMDAIVAIQSVAATATSTRPARLIGTTTATTPDLAAFVNGTAIRSLDFNDDYFGTDESNARGDNGPHPSDNIGAVLAAAQMVGADGGIALLGTVLAYEVSGQLVDEVVLRSNGWDYTIFHAIATCRQRRATVDRKSSRCVSRSASSSSSNSLPDVNSSIMSASKPSSVLSRYTMSS